jgi:hypothetical protein
MSHFLYVVLIFLFIDFVHEYFIKIIFWDGSKQGTKAIET